MLCELCSEHKNPEENRFCGMCGMPLEGAVFKSVRGQNEIREAGAPQDTTTGEPRVQTGIAPPVDDLLFPDDDPVLATLLNLKDNPVGEELAAVSVVPCSEHQLSMTHSTATSFLGDPGDEVDECSPPASLPRASGGISGPSFLGLQGDQASGGDPLEEEPRSHWRGYLLALGIVGLALLGWLQWHTEVRNEAQTVAAMMRARVTAVFSRTKSQDPPMPTAGNVAAAPSHADYPGSNMSPPAGTRTERPDAPEEQPPSGSSPRQDKKLPPHNSKFASRPSERASNSMLIQAQKYLHARNCQQGMLYLQQAVRLRSPEALSQMGALYATGTCVQQNRVEAYNWFSSALNRDPGNRWFAHERNVLYGAMTSSERRQIGR